MRSTTTLSEVSCWRKTSIRELTACCTTKKTTSFIMMLFFVFLGMGSLQAQVQGPNQLLSCDVTNYGTQTAQHGMWLPCVPANGHDVWRFADGAPGTLTHYDDGTATFTGTVTNTHYTHLSYVLDLHFSARKNWTDWSACGGDYKDEHNHVTDEYLDWSYYIFDPVIASTLTLVDNSNNGTNYSGEVLYLIHHPDPVDPNECPEFGFQFGMNANSKDVGLGGATWFRIGEDPDGNLPIFCGEEFDPGNCHGDFNLDISCDPEIDCIPIVAVDCETVLDMEVACDSDYSPAVTGTPDVDIYYLDGFCPEPTYTLVYDDVHSGGCPDIVTRTWSTVDIESINVCVQTITLTDDVPPVFNQEDSEQTIPCNVAIDFLPPTAVDNCTDDVTIVPSSDYIPGNCPNEWTDVYIWTATDACGNSAVLTHTVHHVDNEAPMVTYVPYDKYQECSELVVFEDIEYYDNCDSAPIVTINDEEVAGDCPNEYSIVRTWTVTDACGNETEVSSSVHLTDNTAPVIMCDLETTEGFQGDYAVANWDLIQGQHNNAYVNAGDAPNSIEFGVNDLLDAYGGDYSDLTIIVAQSGAISFSWEIMQADTVIGYGEFGYILNGERHPLGELIGENGSIVVQVEEGDVFGFYIYDDDRDLAQVDILSNFISSAPDATYECSDDIPEMPSTLDAFLAGGGMVDDNCGFDYSYFSAVETSDDGDCTEILTRTYTVKDLCGNEAVCVQVITLEDTQAPYPVEEIPYYSYMECDQIVVPEPEFMDDCNAVNVVFNESIGDCGSEYYSDYDSDYCYCITWTWDVDDGCGNTASFMQVAMITDSQAPYVEGGNPPEVITIQCDEDVPAFAPVFHDNCTADEDLILTAISGISAPDCVDGVLQTISRSASAEDECGNVTTVSQVVYIRDDESPVISGEPTFDLECSVSEDGFMYIVYDNMPTIVDNCDQQPWMEHSYQWYDATCGEQIIVVWDGQDHCGNPASFTQVYTIVDNEDPVMLCDFSSTIGFAGEYAPENWTLENTNGGDGSVDVSNAPSSIELTGTDNGADNAYTYYTTNVVANGAIKFTWEVIAEDCDGPDYDYFGYVLNGDHTQLATVIDNGQVMISVNAGDVFSFYASTTDGICDPIITIASEFMANGNGAYQCGEVVAPMPENLEDFLAGGGFVSDNCEIDPESYTANEVSEGSCPEVITRTYTIADLCGNTTQCIYQITISDDLPPVLVGVPEDMDVECDDIPEAEDYDVTAEDCSDVTIESNSYDIYDPLLDCEFGDANLPGNQQDWSLWLPGLPGYSENWVAVGTINLLELPGGAHLSGAVVNADDPNAGFIIDVMFHNKADYLGWTSQMTTDGMYNRAPKIFDPVQVGTEYENWDYYEMDESAATLTGTGDLSGDVYSLTHAPANLKYAFQVGNGANNMSMDYGYGGWFGWIYTDEDGNETENMGDFGGSNDGNCDIVPGCYDRQRIITWTATDACGNVSSESTIFNILDTTPPVFDNCPEDLVLECDEDVPPMNECSATDNCSETDWITYTSNADTVVTGCQTVITRTWTATDICENTATCVQVITIDDTTAPVITGGDDYVAECDGFGNMSELDAWLESNGGASATDNCNEFSWSNDFEGLSDDCGATGSADVTFTATDICGNASSYTATFTIEDTTHPTIISVPDDVTVQCITDVPELDPYAAVGDDMCSEVIMTAWDEYSGEDMCDVVISRYYKATDACLNSSELSVQTITVHDNVKPVITAGPYDVYAECDQVPEFGPISYEDNCDLNPTPSHVDVIVEGDCPQNYTIIRTWVVTDNCGNVSDPYSAAIIVSDNTPPMFVELPEGDVYLTDCIDPVIEELEATDNCGDVEITWAISPRSGGCPTGASYQIDYTATDECGNFTTASTFVHVNDATPPVITNPAQDAMVECDGDGNMGEFDAWVADFASMTAVDNCSEVAYSYEIVSETDDCGETSVISVRFTATDSCGNSVDDLADFIIKDTTAPEINPGDDLTVECDGEGNMDDLQAWLDNNGGASASDDCGDATWSNNYCTGDNNVEGVETYTENFDGMFAEDLFVNQVTPTNDYFTSPYASMTSGTWEVLDFNTFNCPVLSTPNALTWNTTCCTSDDATISFSQPAFDVSFGLADNTELQVTVNHDGGSTIHTFLGNGVLGNNVELTETGITSLDFVVLDYGNNYGCLDNLTYSVGSTDCVSLSDECGATGSVTVEFTATDDCGNSSTTSGTFTIEDTTPPTIDVAAENDTTECGYEAMYLYDDWVMYNGGAMASDDCSDVTWSSDVLDEVPGCGNTMATTVQFTATDDCGNSASTTATFVTIDTTPPAFVELPEEDVYLNDCIDPVIEELEAYDNCGEATVTWAIAPRSGGCPTGASYQIDYTATDECGNTTMASTFVHVNDLTPPMITMDAQDATVECDGNGNMTELDAWLADFAQFEAEDNCSDVEYSYEILSQTDDCGATGVTTVLFTATDICGNSISDEATFTIEDTVYPELTPGDDLTVECSMYSQGDDAYYNWLMNNGGATASDDCSDVSWSYYEGDWMGDCGYTGSRTVTFKATDECLNSTTWEATYTVVDTTPPSIDIEAMNDTAECGYEAMYQYEDWLDYNGGAMASDDCGYVSWSQLVIEEVEGCGNTGSVTVEFTATDDCGNSASTTATFVTIDTTPPAFVELPEEDVYLNDCIDPVIEELEAYDNCGEATVTWAIAPRSGGCPTGASYQIDYTATDECGNTTMASTFVHVNDLTPPMITMDAQDATVECDGNGNMTELDAWLADFAQFEAEDNCSDVEYSYEILSQTDDCGATGVTTVLFTATDICGNSISDEATFTIEDTVYPELTPGDDLTVECSMYSEGDDAYYNWLMNNGGATASDDCSDVSWTYDEGDWMEDCGYTGSRTVTFKATDECLNSTTWEATYTVVDTTPPSIDIEAMNDTAECGYEAMYQYEDWLDYNGGAMASDDCGYVSWSQLVIEEVEGCGNTGSVTVEFTATDDCGNSASTTATFVIEDTTAPEWEVAPIQDIYLSDCVEPEFNNPIAWDACGDAIVTYVDLPRSGGCPTGMSYERVFTATDECGNSIEASTFVHINDLTPPVVDEEAMDAEAECDGAGNAAEYQAWLDMRGGFEASDNCSGVSYSYEATELEGCSEFTGGYYVVFTATDTCGNAVSSDATFHIYDTTAPELVGVPENILDPVECDAIPPVADVTANDDCSEVDLVFDQYEEYESDEYMCEYTIVRTWTATDECNNVTSATQTINVQDNTAPVFDTEVEPELTVECDNVPEPEELTGTDNCTEGVLYAYSMDEVTPGDCPAEYTITRTYYLADMCENVATQVQTINVQDTQAPVFGESPEYPVYACITDVLEGDASEVEVTDNCSEFVVAVGDVVSPDGCNYVIERTWTAIDACGNTSTLSVTILVIDDVAPIIEYGPQDVTVTCADLIPDADYTLIYAMDNCSEVTISHSDVLAGDDCNATLTRTYTATDACGNATDYVQVITVHDNVAPEFVMVPDNLELDCYADVPAINPEDAMAVDNCNNVTMTAADVMVEGDECNGIIERTYTATDDCGNASTHVQTISVHDNVYPTIISGPEDEDVSCLSEIPDSDISLIIATDNCSEVVITVNDELSEEASDCYAVLTRTYKATDACLNSTLFVQTIMVMDEIAPVITAGPMDESYQCVDDVPEAGSVTAEDNCMGEVNVSMVQTESGDDCDLTITRTWTAYDECQNPSEPWVQVISVMDDTAPELVGAPDDIDVDCGDDIPEPADVFAMDNCSGLLDVEYSEINNAPENPPCVAETPFGMGGSWAIWLPFLEDGDLTAFWVFDANGGMFTEYEDGTATLTGNVVNTGDNTRGFDINIQLEDRKNWTDWHADGGNYKDDFGYGEDYYETWSYYLLSDVSTLVATGTHSGTLDLTHAPANQVYGIQVGIGANNIGPNYGGGGWFDYTGSIDDVDVTGNGDVGFDLECIPCDYTILRTWSAIDDCENEVSHTQIINVISVPEPPQDEDMVEKPETQNYAMLSTFPNPFTDKNNIEFEIAEDADVILSVYNTDGKLIEEMFRGRVEAHNSYRFEFNAVNLPTGVYVYKLVTPKDVFIERVVLTR